MPLRGLGKYPILATSTSVNNCYLTDVLKKAKGRFLKPKKFQNHSKEGRGKEKKKERGEGKKEKRKK